MMDLHCCETAENEITACLDEALLHPRVLENMLKSEERHVPVLSRGLHIHQPEITEKMIAIVGEWMMEVCEEQKCQDDVFLLAMNYKYRFLRNVAIAKNQLQLLGAACMLLASKLREPKPLSVEMLVFYTDHSITKDMLMKWELLVLSKLKWEIVTIVPVDFLPHLLITLDVERRGISYEMVKNHAKILITLCAKEYRFSMHHPSQIACASIISALCGLGWVTKYHQDLNALLRKLADLISVETDIMRELVSRIDEMIKENFTDLERDKSRSEDNEEMNRPEQCTPPPGKVCEPTMAKTPTDVHDIYF